MIARLRLAFMTWRSERLVRKVGAHLVVEGVILRASLDYMLKRIAEYSRFSWERSSAVIAAQVVLASVMSRATAAAPISREWN